MPTVTVDEIEDTAVIGAGLMGRGIAAVMALAGYSVTLQDIDADQLNDAQEHIEWSYSRTVDHGTTTKEQTDAALNRLSTSTDLEAAASNIDFAIEAVVEQQTVKEAVFEELDVVAPDHALLATNTSGLNITNIAEATTRPAQVIGMHWFNPPMLMDLVEVIMTEHTPTDVADTGESLVESFGKTPIRCKRDIPNFIVNRLMRPYGESAAWLVYHEEATIEAVDSAMKYHEEFPMGPFELADYTGGIQIRVEGEQDHLQDNRPLSFDTRVCPLLRELYDAGHYGRKTNRGFYDYTDQDSPAIPEAAGDNFDTLLIWGPVINEAAKIVQHNVASVEDVDTGAKLGGNWPMGPFEKADEIGAEQAARACIEYAQLLNHHEPTDHFNKAAELLPCDLLIRHAKTNDSFY